MTEALILIKETGCKEVIENILGIIGIALVTPLKPLDREPGTRTMDWVIKTDNLKESELRHLISNTENLLGKERTQAFIIHGSSLKSGDIFKSLTTLLE